MSHFGNVRWKPKNKERMFNFSGTKEYMGYEIILKSGRICFLNYYV